MGKKNLMQLKAPLKADYGEKNRCSDEMQADDSLQNTVIVKDTDNHFGRNAKTYKCFFTLCSLD